MEQNRQPRNKPSYLWSENFDKHSMEKGQSFQQMVLEKLNNHMQKNKTGPILYTIQKLTQNGSKR